MKAFNKLLATLFMATLFFMFPCLTTFAEESKNAPPSTFAENSSIGVGTDDDLAFFGFPATIRDCKELNIRKKPDDSSTLLATVTDGEIFYVFEQSGKWFRVEYQGISGYAFWKYISFIEEDISENSDLLGNSIIQYKSSTNRDTNIAIACATINGIMLKPNEEFRWSKIVGKTTKKKGYLEAPVIINKKSATGLGGGVCQVSTALYNALLDTTIIPTELHKHSIGSAYAKKDATVAYGHKDFAFKNTYDFPIRIEASSYYSVVFVSIYKEN